MRTSFSRVFATVLLSACSSTTAPDAVALNDIYTVSQIGSGAICAPAALPSPTVSDTSRYVPVPDRADTSQVRLVVVRAGASISFASLDSRGQASSALLGSIDEYGNTSAFRSSTTAFAEAPRAGGHSFFVDHSTSLSGSIIGLPLLPPGVGSQFLMMSTIVDTYTFREGSGSGSIYTTCTATRKITGFQDR